MYGATAQAFSASRNFWLSTLASRPTSCAAQRRARKSRVVHSTGLSEREVDVLRLIAAGKSNQQIADELFISLNTVSHHLRNIFGKTGTVNRTEAASFAYQQGLTTKIRPARTGD